MNGHVLPSLLFGKLLFQVWERVGERGTKKFLRKKGDHGPRMAGLGNTKTRKGLSLQLPISLWDPLSVPRPEEGLLGSADDV